MFFSSIWKIYTSFWKWYASECKLSDELKNGTEILVEQMDFNMDQKSQNIVLINN